jgi:hypothetical protein
VSFILACKHKALKANVKVWNEEVFSNIGRQKKLLLEELRGLEVVEEEGALCDEERVRKGKVINELERLILMEEVSWIKKSKALWLREGDKCTKFFYGTMNSNRRNESIDSLIVGGTISID